MENVKQLKGHDKGSTLKVILEHLRNVGYENTQYQVLRARDFGLPQNRERLYIVGFLDKDIRFNFPSPTFEKTKVGDILDLIVDAKYTISDKLWKDTKEEKERINLREKGLVTVFLILNQNIQILFQHATTKMGVKY
ncbi:DNA-cytosine methyltransferase (EC [uncultured Gammaproteobacteria bacterium]|nr:DNA-cytosine methyltransferase (EC [uncultured Gammaproteobacteria bacterium]